MFFALIKGFATSTSLIIAIGAQNSFVIRQSLLNNHLLLTALICSIIDAFLISLGVLGVGGMISEFPKVMEFFKYFAIIFLFFYGSFSLKSSFAPRSIEQRQNESASSKKKTIGILLALGLLNPHAYLDTVVLLGSIASQQAVSDQIYFGVGAITASFVWFFSLTYGARLLAPLFFKPISWKVVDIFSATVMWGIAYSLYSSL